MILLINTMLLHLLMNAMLQVSLGKLEEGLRNIWTFLDESALSIQLLEKPLVALQVLCLCYVKLQSLAW